MAHTKFPVEVLTPEGEVFSGEVEMLSTFTAVGSLGILANHEPVLAMLEPTELRLYRSEEEIVRFAQAEGYLQFADNSALVLVEEALAPEQIDRAALRVQARGSARQRRARRGGQRGAGARTARRKALRSIPGGRAVAASRRRCGPSRSAASLPRFMSATREPIGVIGTGYVGLVTAAGFAELGSEVWCVDIDAAKVERLRRGEVPIYEPGLEQLLARNAERLHFSTDIADALAHSRLLFVAVGTPPTYSGDADLSAVHAVAGAIPASKDHALVMKSTVPCGTGASLLRVFGEQGKEALGYVSCPEFLKEGSAVNDFLHPDRVVVGDAGGWGGDAVVELYAPLDAPLVRTDVASAEMVKLASNAFLATKISFINEIANVCEETGADVVEVARGMGLDDRIGPKFLQAGIGFGGSCFPEGRRRAQAARRQLRLSLPAADGRDRGQRAAEAPGDRQAAQAPRRACGQARGVARPRVQAEYRRYAGGFLAGALRAPARRRGERRRV